MYVAAEMSQISWGMMPVPCGMSHAASIVMQFAPGGRRMGRGSPHTAREAMQDPAEVTPTAMRESAPGFPEAAFDGVLLAPRALTGPLGSLC